MEITKSDAIVWMAIKIGTSDGTFSEQEMFDAITKTSYAKFFNDAYSNGISEKIDSNELNAHSAISLMQQLPREEKIEALAICLGIAISDREFTPQEKEVFIHFLVLLGDGITIDEVNAKYQMMAAMYALS